VYLFAKREYSMETSNAALQLPTLEVTTEGYLLLSITTTIKVQRTTMLVLRGLNTSTSKEMSTTMASL